MFVGDEVLVDAAFPVARERLAQLAAAGALAGPSEDVYGREAAGLVRVGVAGVAKLVRVQVRELAGTDRSAGLAIRWEATGPGGRLFPVLDADIQLVAAGQHATWLTMAGVYRPPLGGLGEILDGSFATIRHRTVRSKGCLSNKTALAMIFKLAEAAEKSWRRLDGHNQLPKVILGVKFADGIEVVRSQTQAAAA